MGQIYYSRGVIAHNNDISVMQHGKCWHLVICNTTFLQRFENQLYCRFDHLHVITQISYSRRNIYGNPEEKNSWTLRDVDFHIFRLLV